MLIQRSLTGSADRKMENISVPRSVKRGNFDPVLYKCSPQNADFT